MCKNGSQSRLVLAKREVYTTWGPCRPRMEENTVIGEIAVLRFACSEAERSSIFVYEREESAVHEIRPMSNDINTPCFSRIPNIHYVDTLRPAAYRDLRHILPITPLPSFCSDHCLHSARAADLLHDLPISCKTCVYPSRPVVALIPSSNSIHRRD